jgi:hypothetical protein
MGPISPNSTELHPCFPARIFFDFQTAQVQDPSDPGDKPACFESCPLLQVALFSSHNPEDFSVTFPDVESPLAAPVSPFHSPSFPTSTLPPLESPSPASTLFSRTSLSPLSEIVTLPPSLIPINSRLQISSWRLGLGITIDQCEDDAEFFLKAPDIDNAAQALMEFFVAKYSGSANLSRDWQTALRVKIQCHLSVSGLFFNHNVTFHV